MSQGGNAKLDSWELEITAIPEPAVMVLILGVSGAMLFIKRWLID